MSSVIPVPSTRVPNQLARDRLIRQLSSDQIDLVRLQTQISTGRRVLTPSDDAPAALRGMALQALIERKTQVQVNLQTNQSFLGATDAAISDISQLLASVRSTALGVVDSGASDAQRAAAAEEVDRALQQLVDTGNQQFRGRYLFSGSSTSVKPFENRNNSVEYLGNETDLQSYADTDLLFQTNANGNTVFGAVSAEVRGTTDLNPVLNEQTLLSDLRGGQGIAKGSISISVGLNTSIIDLSRASTIGDIKAIIEAHPPAGREVSVTVTNRGLEISIDSSGGGDLKITNVGGGTTATELGILQESAAGTGPFVGSDLNPRLTKTTPIRDILGTPAKTIISSPGSENDLIFTARTNGVAFNNVTVQFVDNPAIVAGSETVAYDTSNPANPKLIFQIDAGNTSANSIISALNNNPAVAAIFSAELEPGDTIGETNIGTGLIATTATGTTSGGAGVEFDRTSGIRVKNGEYTHNINFVGAVTIEDMLNRINGAGVGLAAEINDSGTGINIRSTLSGVNFSVGENGGTTASELGLRSFDTTTRLDGLNHGFGVHDGIGVDFSIRRKDGEKFDIDVAGATTIQDVVNLINNHARNQDPTHKVTARLAAFGNGIELVTSDTSTTSSLAVLKGSVSQAAIDLGLIAAGQTESAPATSSGGTDTLTGQDVNPTEVGGIFNALVRLRDSLRANDPLAVSRAVELLDASDLNLNNQRAEIGARQQSLDTLKDRLEGEVISLKSSLSNEIEIDLAQAISDMTARQSAYEATLQTTASISRLSLLDFL